MNRFHLELRGASVTGNTLSGHAAVYGQTAQIRGGYEALAPGVFDEALKHDDVAALVNHDPSLLLGRTSSGTLRLAADDAGLAFEVDLPDTGYGRDVRELVGRRDMAGMSFGFIPGTDTLGHAPDGKQLRTHTSIKQLLDVSVVTYPAYDGTDVTLRHLEISACPDNRTRLILARHRARLSSRRFTR